MAIKVKPVDVSAKKWGDNAGRAAEEFARNAEAAADEWARATSGAADTYRQGISASGISERFRRGVLKAGAAKFARKIREVARDRFGPGVAAAVPDYNEGVTPYLQTLAGMTLSPRRARGDPANYNRVNEIGKALNAKRLALLGATGSAGA